MSKPYRILIVGCGRMGTSHGKAYLNRKDCEIVGVVSRSQKSRDDFQTALGRSFDWFQDIKEALDKTRPDIVCISTYPDTHVEYAMASLHAGAHVFLEKPIATTVKDAEKLRETALKCNKKLYIGYILRSHPSWKAFVKEAQKLGSPYVMRMNLNQQQHGKDWRINLEILKTLSPIVDCGVHYVDVMCQVTRSKPSRVHAIGARLGEAVPEHQYNYGCLQVVFEDNSVGWYEAGWGPMMSQEAFFIKDIIGTGGSISLVAQNIKKESQDIEGHTRTGALLRHFSELDEDGNFAHSDVVMDTSDEPDHDGLCALEQDDFLNAISQDLNLDPHLEEAVNSLKIVLAADESIKTGKVVYL